MWIKVTELCESLVLPFLCLPLAIYSKQHQTSFVHGQGHLLFVILTRRLNAKANLKSMQDHLLLLPCLYVLLATHRMGNFLDVKQEVKQF